MNEVELVINEVEKEAVVAILGFEPTFEAKLYTVVEVTDEQVEALQSVTGGVRPTKKGQ